MKNSSNLTKLQTFWDIDKYSHMFATHDVNPIFNKLSEMGVKEISVSRPEMNTIISFLLANTQGGDESIRIMKEGKVDKFWGVKLRLEQ